MKFLITKEAFLNGLNHVQNVVSSRTTLPILSNVLLEAKDDGLHLTTTDLDVGVSAIISDAKIEEAGMATLPARRLAAIIRELPSGDISVTIDHEHKATITSGPSIFRIFGLSAEEFPALPSFEDVNEYILPQKELKDGLKKTSYAMSTDESRYVLNGILFSFQNAGLTLVATDGRRLALTEIEIEFPESLEAEAIIPTKAINEIQRLLGDEGEVRLRLGKNQASFDVGASRLVTKIIDGSYPNFRQVIPSKKSHRITLEREVLLKVIQRVSLIITDRSQSAKFAFGDNSIQVSVNLPEVGAAEEALAVNYSGEQFAVAYNPEFMMAPLRNLDEDEIYLDLIDESSPGVIRIDGSFLYVIMPIRAT